LSFTPLPNDKVDFAKCSFYNELTALTFKDSNGNWLYNNCVADLRAKAGKSDS
jgi:hypothetical protein